MKRGLFIVFFLLSSCYIRPSDKDLNAWIDLITKTAFYADDGTGTKKIVQVDRSTGNITVEKSTGKIYYRLDQIISGERAVYTRLSGSYIGMMVTDIGLQTAKYVDTVSAPSRQKGNIDFTQADRIVGTFTP